MLEPDDVGHRVVVRHMVDGRLRSDALGRLTAVTPTHVTVRTATGEVAVARTAITAAKRIPDHRARSATERLELVAARHWPAVETGRLGDWLLRASDGWTGRGNTALTVGDPGHPVAAALDAVTAWYTARGLWPALAVPLPLGRRVQAEADRRGWETITPTLVQTAVLADLDAAPEPDVVLHPTAPEDWLAAVGGRKGGLPAAARRVLTGVPTARYAAGYVDGTLVATARGAVSDGWLGISVVGVEPAHRRHGWATRVTRALVGWAGTAGADRAYLQVEEGNTAAVRMYGGLGFRTAHTYVVRRPAPCP